MLRLNLHKPGFFLLLFIRPAIKRHAIQIIACEASTDETKDRPVQEVHIYAPEVTQALKNPEKRTSSAGKS